MNTNDIISQIEMNKAIIQRYFEAYNNKNETIFDEITSSDYIDHGQSAYMGSPGRGIDGAKNDLMYSLDKLDDLNYVVEDMIASSAYPNLVGTYWKGTLIPKVTFLTSKLELPAFWALSKDYSGFSQFIESPVTDPIDYSNYPLW